MTNDKIIDPKRRPGTVDVGTELGRRVFGAFISIEPGETRELSFSYRLPTSVAAQVQNGNYSLLVQKQPGLRATPLTIDLDFGKKLKTAVPAEDAKEFGDTRYRTATDLRIDRLFTAQF
jgi:hypothetical protein